ncbi:putative oxidoreductase YcsN [Flagellimonas maritima]|uniref:Putative oxidoreductase YcsN n=1 Tax=Flagellimonas maritima TaxID=1383885 RepID=A0A2Z4LQH6_9FLAO|nr:aldo/keto reductase [Allomuricauda aurantiaca]AWX44066.1 putative oxidoreductase YcsN [Allomuricauda aurantiaca]
MKLTKDSISPYIIGTMRLGTWGSNLTTAEYEKFIEGCIDLNLVDFDHADIYGHYTTEEDFGKVLKSRKDLRKKMRITTKCGIKLTSENRPDHKIKSYDLSAEHINVSVEKSLANLKTDYIDVLLLHRPDYLFDPHEIAETFSKLKKEGKVLDVGVSNFSPSQFDLLNSLTPLITNQVEISLLHRNAFEDGTLDQCQKLKVIPTAWSPLGGGILFKDSKDKKIQAIQKTLNLLAEKYSAANDQILYAWLRKHPAGIVPVLGTSKIERIKAASEALNISLTHEEWYMLWQAALGREID